MTGEAVCKNCGKPFTYRKTGKAPECCCESCSRDWHTKQYASRNKEVWKQREAIRFVKAEVVKRYRSRCAVCGWQDRKPVKNAQGRVNLSRGCEIHHIIPVREGGKSEVDNLILLCPNCHKQADWGIITREELRKHQRKARPQEECEQEKRKAMQGISLRGKPKQMSMFD